MDSMCLEMQPPAPQQQRIDLAELKEQMVKKLGPNRSELYFNYLNMFMSLRLSKVDFNKICVRIIGKENIPLHNRFLRSILKNACSAELPPEIYGKEILKPVGIVGDEEPPRDGNLQNMPNPLTLSNGDVLQLPPQKIRAVSHDQEGLGHSNALGPNGKANMVGQQSFSGYGSTSMENGAPTPCPIQTPLQHHQELTAHPGNKADGSTSVHSGQQVVEGRKEVTPWSLIEAPRGIPTCTVKPGGAHRLKPAGSVTNCASSFDGGGLSHPRELRECMEQIATVQGVKGVSMECAKVLNNGLDAYLKGLIRSSFQMVGGKSGLEPTKSSMLGHQPYLKPVNGVRLGHHHYAPSRGRFMESVPGRKPYYAVSSQDFRAAMEVNPKQLGENWPALLEQICWPPCKK